MVSRFIKLWAAGAFLFGLADAAFSWNPLAASFYLAHRHEPVFRTVPALKFGSVAEAVNGLIVALIFLSIKSILGQGAVWRNGLLFGLMIWGLWVVAGTMSAFVWINLPVSVALSNVGFGLPKCLAIGCGLTWFNHLLQKMEYPDRSLI